MHLTSMIISLEKPFLLPDYAKAMACSSLIARPTCEPCHYYRGDRRILDFLDISATDNSTFPLDSLASSDDGIIGSCPSSSRFSSVSS
jgi:hypothetical protein